LFFLAVNGGNVFPYGVETEPGLKGVG